ncbi:MAG: glycosyltransferase family 39 protein [Planctomycetes bacterium]|nr:glycosyltransferase family 39 protein [Planctomycetota bacterium]
MRRAHVRLVLAVLIALTAGLRWSGIDFLLPHQREQDAQLVQHLRFARHETADEESGYVNAYPYVLPYLLRAVPATQGDEGEPKTLEQHLAACSAVYVETRSLIALVSLLAVPCAFLLARRFVPDAWALFASALVAFSFLTQWFAQEARPHAAASAMSLLGVVAALRLRERPRWSSYALAGCAAALAVGSLHHGAVVVLAGLAAHFTREGPRSARDHLRLALPVVLVALGLRLFYPFYFTGTDEAQSTVVEASGGELQFGRHAIALDQFTFQGARVVARTLVYYEPVLVVGLLAAAGALIWARRVPRETRTGARGASIVVASYVVPYALVLAAFDETFERFVTPLVPYVAVTVAWGLWRWASSARRDVRAIARTAAAVVLTVQMVGTSRLALLRARPDTMELAAQFVERELDPERDALFLSGKLELPLARTTDSLFLEGGKRARFFSRWAQYQARKNIAPLPPPRWRMRFLAASKALGYPSNDMIADDTLGFLRKLGPGVYLYHVESARGHRADARVYEELRQHGTLLARIAPNTSGPGAEFAIEFQDPLGAFPPMWPMVMTASALGPPIEIYRVESW